MNKKYSWPCLPVAKVLDCICCYNCYHDQNARAFVFTANAFAATFVHNFLQYQGSRINVGVTAIAI